MTITVKMKKFTFLLAVSYTHLKRAFAVDGHVGDNVPFDDAVLVRNAFERVIFVFVEKFC